MRDETAGFLVLIWGDREGICFCGGDWTGQIALIWFGKLVFARNDQGGQARLRDGTIRQCARWTFFFNVFACLLPIIFRRPGQFLRAADLADPA
ncbi:hypothetical protein CQ10_05175 [Bradyrhizobium valentinum]|uniref:Uncharacterized protein n=1 Tax=Bradyrhizobium valentinum TaxID=1518501 RepID=A0A0R3KF48_9BRAD|nr:hypothetical protein CP49_32225 [Bradyrhizobium valentinum]KRQ97224.1 hypothetical protein CQ10_05175 [Bradyrhizobium valentinum]